MTDVFLVASKGIPARYGGFETFAEQLVRGKKREEIRYHVSCMAKEEKHFEYLGADCFNVKVPLPGPAGRILHVARVLRQTIEWKKENPESDTVVYILGCRIGPLMKYYATKLKKLGVRIFVNPDGLEWKRAKWSGPAKRFLRFCEKCLVMNADLVICDSVNIEKYIQKTYPKKAKQTTYLAYGATESTLELPEEKWQQWLEKHHISKEGYYLIVGRFVPDNNYETMLKEFTSSKTKKDLVIVTNVEKNKFYRRLAEETGFEKDARVKFVGTVYEEALLKKIRQNAFAYFHGHEVGGTNPSLLEAMATTDCNLLLGVGFNREVAKEAALYWEKDKGNLVRLMEKAEAFTKDQREELGKRAKMRMNEAYRWEMIVAGYEKLFLGSDEKTMP